MLIDEIMRLEDFASIFIKFCETYKILPNLVEHMEDGKICVIESYFVKAAFAK